jgi:hypothetical protein
MTRSVARLLHRSEEELRAINDRPIDFSTPSSSTNETQQRALSEWKKAYAEAIHTLKMQNIPIDTLLLIDSSSKEALSEAINDINGSRPTILPEEELFATYAPSAAAHKNGVLALLAGYDRGEE